MLNVTATLEDLLRDAVTRTPGLSHVDPDRVMLCVASARGTRSGGVYAKIYPLRFEGGERIGVLQRRGRPYRCSMPEITHLGREILYVIYFLVPRFLDLPARDKLRTLFHELYHISPDFDGDIRRFPGRNFAHGSSRKKYDQAVDRMVEAYLPFLPPDKLPFLESTCAGMRKDFGSLVARKMPVPRLKKV